jgi:hypothetical protein
MALLTVADVKNYMRIDGTAEDAMLATWLLQCKALIESFIGRPITAELRTFILDQDPFRPYHARLFVPMYPIALEDSSAGTAVLEITDVDTTVLVEDTDYRLNRLTGELLALSAGSVGAYFVGYPLTITAYVGLSADPSYSNRIEPAINAALLDLMADRYQRRSPAATSETTGGGISTSYDTVGIPPRVKAILGPFVMARAR